MHTAAGFASGVGAVGISGALCDANPRFPLRVRVAEIGNPGVGATETAPPGRKPRAACSRVSASFRPCFSVAGRPRWETGWKESLSRVVKFTTERVGTACRKDPPGVLPTAVCHPPGCELHPMADPLPKLRVLIVESRATSRLGTRR